MALPQFPLVLAQSVADGTALTGTSIASILHGSGKAILPGNNLQVGSKLRIRIRGRISNIVTTPGTLTFSLLIGGVTVSALGAQQLSATANTNATFELEIEAVIRSIGSGTVATALVTARFTSRSIVGSGTAAAGTNATVMLPDTAPAAGTGFDSSAACVVDVQGVFSLTGNSLTVHDSLIELKV